LEEATQGAGLHQTTTATPDGSASTSASPEQGRGSTVQSTTLDIATTSSSSSEIGHYTDDAATLTTSYPQEMTSSPFGIAAAELEVTTRTTTTTTTQLPPTARP